MMGCFSCCIFLCESIPCDAHRKFGCHVILSLQSIVSHKKSEADALKRFPVEKKLSVRWPFPWQLLKYQNAFAGVAPLLLKYIPIYWDIGAAAMNSISTQATFVYIAYFVFRSKYLNKAFNGVFVYSTLFTEMRSFLFSFGFRYGSILRWVCHRSVCLPIRSVYLNISFLCAHLLVDFIILGNHEHSRTVMSHWKSTLRYNETTLIPFIRKQTRNKIVYFQFVFMPHTMRMNFLK